MADNYWENNYRTVAAENDRLKEEIEVLQQKKATPKLVTFTKWCLNPPDRTAVSVNPAEVSDVEDYCGPIEPGQKITLKNKKVYLVQGAHYDVIAKLNEKEEQ